MGLVKFNKFEKLHEEQTAQAVDAKVAKIDKEASQPNSKYITSDFRTIFNDLRDYITKDIIIKKKPSLLITGAPGVGKSFIVNEELAKAGLVEDKDYVIIKGKSTALAMYISLFENNGKLIIYDDCDSIFKDDDAINVLKGALELSGKRKIDWAVSRTIKNAAGAAIPSKFEFTGQVIFISNISQKAMDMALKSRSLKIEIALTTEGMIEYIKSIINHVEPDKPKAIKDFTLNLIQAVAKENEFVRIDVRNFIKAIGIVEDEDPQDKDYKANIMRKIGQQCDERTLIR